MINWKVRLKNKTFYLAMIPAALLLVQQVCALFGFSVAVQGLSEDLLAIVNTVFSILAIMGIVVDPTTAGVNDSSLALTYDAPKQETEHET